MLIILLLLLFLFFLIRSGEGDFLPAGRSYVANVLERVIGVDRPLPSWLRLRVMESPLASRIPMALLRPRGWILHRLGMTMES